MAGKKNVLKTTIELTQKQRSFVDILVENWGKISKVDAAKQAGYQSKKAEGPVETASRLTNPALNPHVCRYLEKRLSQELQIYEKDRTSLTLRQKQLLASNNKDDFFTVFNEVHNSHLLSTSVGDVTIKTTDDQKKTRK